MLIQCKKCLFELDEEEFRLRKGTKTGRQSYCINCQKAAAGNYYEKNKDGIKRKSEDWQRTNVERANRIKRNWIDKNMSNLQAGTRPKHVLETQDDAGRAGVSVQAVSDISKQNSEKAQQGAGLEEGAAQP